MQDAGEDASAPVEEGRLVGGAARWDRCDLMVVAGEQSLHVGDGSRR